MDVPWPCRKFTPETLDAERCVRCSHEKGCHK